MTAGRRLWLWLTLGAVLLAGAATAVVLRAAGDNTAGGTRWPSPDAVAQPADGGGPPLPLGQDHDWRIVFGDEFDGPELDASRWADRSGAESDEGRGNPGNQQLEWNQRANCEIHDGQLVMIARRAEHTSSSGQRYGWTSCLISSEPSFTFQYGYIEQRAILPTADGFWPAFWTWQAEGVDRQIETDVYEQYSAGSRALQMTQHSGSRGGCQWRLPFDPSADWHTYGAAIEPSGTTWYVDGVKVCQSSSTSDGPTNIIANLAVYAERPPATSTTTAAKRIDYIRAWERA